MRTHLIIATILAVAIAGLGLMGVRPSHADANARVCAQTYGKADGISCNFSSYEQCRASVSGIGGSCIDNPYSRATPNQTRPRVRR